MRTIFIYLTTFLCLNFLSSCTDATMENSNQGASEKELIKDNNIPATTKTKEAILDEWKDEVDQNLTASLDVETYEYTCEGWGGSLAFINEKDKLRAITYVAGGEDGSKIKKFYYNDENQLIIVWQETSLWVGDDNTTTQVTHYIENGRPFKVLAKEAKGTSDTIQAQLASAKTVEGNAQDFADLEAMSGELMGLTSDQIQGHFCN